MCSSDSCFYSAGLAPGNTEAGGIKDEGNKDRGHKDKGTEEGRHGDKDVGLTVALLVTAVMVLGICGFLIYRRIKQGHACHR